MPNNEQALIENQFKPGQSGNPAGGPKGPRMVTLLKKALDVRVKQLDPATNESREMELGEVVMFALVKQASKGNVRAINSIMDRIDGKVVQTMELAGPGGVPLTPPQIVFQGLDPEPEEVAEAEQESQDE